MNKIRLIFAASILLLVSGQVSAAIIPNIIEYGSIINNTTEEVTFSVLYDGSPDFTTILGGSDPDYTYQQVLQFNVDPDSTIPGSGSNRGHTVTPAMRTLACDASNNIPGANTCWEFAFSVHDLVGIIPSTIGTLPFSVVGNLFELSAPFDLLNLGSNPTFTYSIEDGAPNTSIRNVFYGTGGQHYVEPFVNAVPEPATIWLFGTALIGLIGVKWRRKDLLGPKRSP